MLAPAVPAEPFGAHRRQAEDLAQAVADEAVVGGEVDVARRHEGVAAHRLGRLRLQAVSLLDDDPIDAGDRLGTQQVQVALDPPPVEFVFVLLLGFPVPDPHDLTQGPVVLSQVLELIVVVVAAQACRRQDQDFPVAQARPAATGAGLPVDIAGDGVENGITHLGPALDVLEGAENRDGFVAAVEVQGHFGDRRTIQTPLTIQGFPHRFAPRRFGRARAAFGEIRGSGTNSIHSSRSIFAQLPENSSPKRLLRRTLAQAFTPHDYLYFCTLFRPRRFGRAGWRSNGSGGSQTV